MGDGAAGGPVREQAHWRIRGAIAAATLVGAVGLGAMPVAGPWMAVPTTTAVAGAVGVVIAGPSAHRFQAGVSGAAGAASLAVTVGVVLTGSPHAPGDRAVTAWALAETAALFLLTLLAVRVAPPRPAAIAATLSGIAIPSWLLRFGGDSVTPSLLGGFTVWAMVSLLAVAVGLYLRALDERRDRSVADARRAQRDRLARELHDFVAHDISGTIAQAQAGQVLAERDPAAAKAAFRRIEQSGLKAMASLDRAVHMLSDPSLDGAGRRTFPQTLIELPEVVSRFAETGRVAAHLDVDPELKAEELPREITTTGYRIVVEALTNVRRHAPEAGRVTVSVRRTMPTPGLEIVVRDDGGAPPPVPARPAARPGGLGLPGLTERAEALGGTLTAGPAAPTGWRVAAFLPLPPDGHRHHG